MSNRLTRTGQKWVGRVSILSFVVCLAAIYAILAAVRFDASLGYLPVEAIEIAEPRLVFAWGVTDFLGYYLMRAPLILFLWAAFRERNPVLVDSACFCGLLFVILSVTATSVLVGSTMGIIEVYPGAEGDARSGLAAAWEASVAIVRQGLWQFSMLPWTCWTLVMGSFLATEERWLGRALQSIGVAALISAVDPLFGRDFQDGMSAVHDYQVHFSSIWMLWAGIVLVRRDRLLGAD